MPSELSSAEEVWSHFRKSLSTHLCSRAPHQGICTSPFPRRSQGCRPRTTRKPHGARVLTPRARRAVDPDLPCRSRRVRWRRWISSSPRQLAWTRRGKNAHAVNRCGKNVPEEKTPKRRPWGQGMVNMHEIFRFVPCEGGWTMVDHGGLHSLRVLSQIWPTCASKPF